MLLVKGAISARFPESKVIYHERPGTYTCKNGVTYKNIKVSGPPGLNAQQKEDLFNAFIQEALEKNPHETLAGDTVAFRFEGDELKVDLKPADKHKKFYENKNPKDFTKTIKFNSQSLEFQNYQLLQKIIVSGVRKEDALESLHSIAMRNPFPFTVASVFPVGFQNGDANLCAALKLLLADPKVLEKMANSDDEELKRIAIEYKRLMQLQGNQAPIDLAKLKLEAANIAEYENKILRKIKIGAKERPRFDNEVANTIFEKKPASLRVHRDGEPTDDRLKLKLDWTDIQLEARLEGVANPEYSLQSFIVEDNGKLTTYEATVELIMGRHKTWYWEIVQNGNNTIRKNIEQADFASAAKQATDFVYSAELPVLAIRNDGQNTSLYELYENNTNITLEHGNNGQQSMFENAAERGSNILHSAVKNALKAAENENQTTITLPIPSKNARAAIGIMWFAVQEHIREGSGITEIKFQIPREDKMDKDLVQQIRSAQTFFENNRNDFTAFSKQWEAHCLGWLGWLRSLR